MYTITKCTHCGVSSKNQPKGDGCHACSRGTMEVSDKEFENLINRVNKLINQKRARKAYGASNG